MHRVILIVIASLPALAMAQQQPPAPPPPSAAFAGELATMLSKAIDERAALAQQLAALQKQLADMQPAPKEEPKP